LFLPCCISFISLACWVWDNLFKLLLLIIEIYYCLLLAYWLIFKFKYCYIIVLYYLLYIPRFVCTVY
jgi:hypothetical protein